MRQENEGHFSRASRWVLGAVLLLLPILAFQSVRLWNEVGERLDGLSTASADNVQWALSQAEVEHLKLDAAVEAARHDGGQSRVRRRFDIYFSRLSTYQESQLFSDLRERDGVLRILSRLAERRDVLTDLIDVPDDALLQNLDEIHETLGRNAADVRELALIGVVLQTEFSEAKRMQLFGILSRLSLFVIMLVITLVLAVLLLGWLYRRGRGLSEERARAASRMEAMISSSLDPILMVDRRGAILAFNGAAQRVFGYDQRQVIGQPMEALIVPEHLRSEHIARLERYLDSTEKELKGRGRRQTEGLRKSGEVFPLEMSLSVSRAGDETVLVCYLRDISDRIAAEAELLAARDDALAGERAKAEVLTVMSHEMRTPLTGILGAIDLLDDSLHDSDQRRYLEAMRVSGELLLHHVNDVLHLSKLEAGGESVPASTFDLVALMEGIVSSQEAKARAQQLEIGLHCCLGDSALVFGRSRDIQQILLNLIGNALKFTKEGGVNVDVIRPAGSDLVTFTVTDTGEGIAPEDLDRIFDEFTMLDASYRRGNEGTGLGLSITRRMVADMQGEITCESEPGEGSTFSVVVPLPVATEEIEERCRPGETTAEQRRILVVEDNDINRVLLGQMIEKLGHSVALAGGGLPALDLLAAEPFDLVLMDISMPDLDGIETLRRVHERDLAPDSLIVALTAHAAPKDHADIRAAGFADVVTKPIDREKLAEVIARAPAHVLSGEVKGFENGSVAARQAQGADDEGAKITEVIDVLGRDEALQYLQEFCDEVQYFREQLVAAAALSEAERREAHRLAGSGAVLGLMGFRSMMLEIENQPDETMPDLSAFDEVWIQTERRIHAHLSA